jgi:hypothetical protein
MREKNRWRPAFLDQDYKQKLRREMEAATAKFEPGPRCEWCRDTGVLRDRRTGTERPCPHCRRPAEPAKE